MRTLLPRLAAPVSGLALCLTLGLAPATGADAAPATANANDSKPTLFIKNTVSARKVAVNQAVRLEFVTMPRQIEGIDIAGAVANGIGLAGAGTWKLLGKPLASENEKTRIVTVVVSLLPRTTGDISLPSIPLTWLSGEPRTDFGTITIEQRIAIAGEDKPLPPEYDGVGGFAWGARQDELIGKQIPATAVSAQGDRTVAKVSGSLEVGFRGGELSDAVLLASGLTLESARTSFCGRWGMPLSEEPGNLTWVLGWTRITATPSPDGVRIELLREDIQAKIAAGQVKSRVFNLLEGGPLK